MIDYKAMIKLSILRLITQLFFIFVLLVFVFGYLYQIWIFGIKGIFDPILIEHFLATVGLPLAVISSVGIVSFFEFQFGPSRFQGLGFKFFGASGRIILWIFCFLAIVGALKLLW